MVKLVNNTKIFLYPSPVMHPSCPMPAYILSCIHDPTLSCFSPRYFSCPHSVLSFIPHTLHPSSHASLLPWGLHLSSSLVEFLTFGGEIGSEKRRSKWKFKILYVKMGHSADPTWWMFLFLPFSYFEIQQASLEIVRVIKDKLDFGHS